jgi:phospholipid/cholesterol/gamma-HCH transport system substrate-binding protein
MREVGPIRALVNVALAVVLLGVAGYGATLVAKRHWQWQETFRVRAEFAGVGGLNVGDKVRVQGMDAGTVAAIEPPEAPGGPVVVVMRIDERLRPLVRVDAVASIGTQGVVGAKVVEIKPGRPDAPTLSDGGSIAAETPTELAELLDDARGALARIESVAVAAEEGLGEVNAIAASIRKGEGTLGRLVRDDEAYERLISLSERGERAVVSLDENLSALKGMWPLSGYFRERGFDDIERVLYRPGAIREARVFPSEDLFQPNTALLTGQGRSHLDEFARWFKEKRWPDSTEIVIAAFTDPTSNSDQSRARILTGEQARAVRSYLESEHKLFSLSWWRKRKAAAVGFGARVPATATAEPQGPLRRVEIALFTPQD